MKASLTVTPGTVMAGDPVKVDGTTPGVCKPTSQVLVYSSAFNGQPCLQRLPGCVRNLGPQPQILRSPDDRPRDEYDTAMVKPPPGKIAHS